MTGRRLHTPRLHTYTKATYIHRGYIHTVRLHTLIASNVVKSSKILHSGLVQASQTAQEICTHNEAPLLELKEDVLLKEGHSFSLSFSVSLCRLYATRLVRAIKRCKGLER